MYVAIIGDLVKSREINAREDAQRKLKAVLEKINETHQTQLASRFSVTLGDEFQGLLHSPDHILELLFDIKYQLYPIQVRFGIGLGEILTEIDPLESIGADGPAYHAARRLIGEVKRSESGKKAVACDMMFGGKDQDECLESINAGLGLIHFMENHWSPKQFENIYDSFFLGLNQSQIAEKKGVNQSTVHRSLSAAGYYEFEKALKDFQRLLDRKWKELT